MDELRAIRLLYRTQAVCSVCLIGIFALIYLAAAIWGDARINHLPFFVDFAIGVSVGCCAFAAFGLLIGMGWDCLIVSQLPVIAKIGWVLLNLLAFPVGPVIYYFVRYNRRASAPIESDAVAPIG
jgi:hypothetical protein